jgi:anaerobic selenocysteine-containing dehydrogenase
MERGSVRLNLPGQPYVPFADGRFRTPSGKVEIYSQQLADAGEDPLPGWVADEESAEAQPRRARRYPLQLVSPADHYFLHSSFGNLPALMRRAKEPTLEICGADAAERGIRDGDWAIVENERGSCRLRARITTTVRPGVVATTTVWWNRYSPDGRNVNFTTSDALSDRGNCATFHGNLVQVRKAVQ